MRVLLHLDSLNRGGAETLALDICRNGYKQGLEITFAASGGGVLETEFIKSGVEYVRFARRLPVDPLLVLSLRRQFIQNRIEIAQGFQPVEATHLYLAALGLPVKVVLSHQGFIGGLKNRISARVVSGRVDANIAASRSLLPWLESELRIDTKKGFHVIWNAVDEQRLRQHRKSIRNELGLPKNTYLLGMTGNFRGDGTKDQMTICRALEKVFAFEKNAAFLFAGATDGQGSQEFQACADFCKAAGIDDKVFFLGSRKDVGAILAELDLFVFSSRIEGFGIAVAEAMINGTPLIVSNIGPLLEVTRNGELAGVFEVGDHESLAAMILRYLENKELRASKSAELRRYALENFTIDSHIGKLLKLYKSLS